MVSWAVTETTGMLSGTVRETTGMVPGTVTLMLFSETPVTIQTSLLCPMPTAISDHPQVVLLLRACF